MDLVITDPPYFISSKVVIQRSAHRGKYRATKAIVLDFGRWDHFADEDGYWRFTNAWLGGLARVMRPGAHLVTFFDEDRISPLITSAKRQGLLRRQHLYWLKSNPAPRARKVDFMIALEHAVWFTKGMLAGETFNYQLGQQKNYVQAALPNHPRLHPTQKPEAALRVWMAYLTHPGDVVLDPFTGSGTTPLVARELGRRFIGFEREPGYVQIARRRLGGLRLTAKAQ